MVAFLRALILNRARAARRRPRAASSSPRWRSSATPAPGSTGSAAPSATWATARPDRLRRPIDTVGVGNINNWNFDPFEGMEDDEVVGGRGGSDQLGGVVSAVYGGAVARDLGLLPTSTPTWSPARSRKRTATACAGCTSSRRRGVKPDFIVSTEPTDHGVYRGHRGGWRSASTSPASPATARPRARRQRDLQDGRDPPRGPRAQRPPPRRRLPRQGHRHHLGDLLHLPVALRGRRLVRHLAGPPPHLG